MMASSPTNVRRLSDTHRHTHTKQRKAWEATGAAQSTGLHTEQPAAQTAALRTVPGDEPRRRPLRSAQPDTSDPGPGVRPGSSGCRTHPGELQLPAAGRAGGGQPHAEQLPGPRPLPGADAVATASRGGGEGEG
eukprot:237135-Hanusia_phi.AAC.1